MLAFRASPSASISSAQNGSTGQNPWNTNSRAKTSENRQVQAKNSFAPAGVSEQFGASSMRWSMMRKNNSTTVALGPQLPPHVLERDHVGGGEAAGRFPRSPGLSEHYLIGGREPPVAAVRFVSRPHRGECPRPGKPFAPAGQGIHLAHGFEIRGEARHVGVLERVAFHVEHRLGGGGSQQD